MALAAFSVPPVGLKIIWKYFMTILLTYCDVKNKTTAYDDYIMFQGVVSIFTSGFRCDKISEEV